MADGTLELRTQAETIRLRFVAEPPRIYLLASEPDALWPSAVLRMGRATILVGTEPSEGRAFLVTDIPTRERVVRRFRDEAGPERADRWYGHSGRLIAIEPDDGVSSPEAYGQWLSSEFDASAAEYTERLEHNPVERRFRRRSVNLLARTFPVPGHLLEIGSGTGIETIPMLRAGHRVVAVDVSQRMLAELRDNARRSGYEGPLTTRLLRARDLAALVTEFGSASFDGAYSTFGALNLEPDLGPIARALATLLRPGARFVAGVFSRHTLFDPIAAVLTGHPGRIRARRRQPAPVGSHRFSVDVYFRSVAELRRTFSPEFILGDVQGLGVVLPPPNLADRLERWGTNWDRLDRLDMQLGSRRGLAGLGEQFLAVFERTGAY